ncbi:TPA: hypothetical protein ACLNVG_003628, partial [Vibrio cholerae O1]
RITLRITFVVDFVVTHAIQMVCGYYVAYYLSVSCGFSVGTWGLRLGWMRLLTRWRLSNGDRHPKKFRPPITVTG